MQEKFVFQCKQNQMSLGESAGFLVASNRKQLGPLQSKGTWISVITVPQQPWVPELEPPVPELEDGDHDEVHWHR